MSGPGVTQHPAAPAPGARTSSETIVVAKAMERQVRASGSLISGFCPGPEGLWECFLPLCHPLLPGPHVVEASCCTLVL